MLRCCRTQHHPSPAGAPARRASSLLAAAAAAVGGGGGCCARPPALQLPAAAAPAVTAAAAARASAAHVRRHGGGGSGSSGSGGPGLGIAAAATPGGAPRDGPLAPAFAAISSGRLLLLQRLRSWSGADRAEKALKEKQQRQQQQQAARVRAKCFRAAAKRVFPLHALRAVPPKPPPLSALPAEPLPADSIPPLLEWVTTARMRPVAVQSILEQHCSPGVRRIVAAAAQLAEAEQEEQSWEGKGAGGGILITSAHLALAALADGDVDCAAALGVLHHSQAGLSLRRCVEMLADRVAERVAETLRHEDSGSSSSGKGSSGSGGSIFSAPALHFLFQSYRWAVFTGCDTVQPCHLLWALAADPRVSYSPLRTDPLDGRVAAAEVQEPPLVWLLQQCSETLPRPAAVYEQLLGVLQRGGMTTCAAAAKAAAAANAGGGGGGSAVNKQAAGSAAPGSGISGSSSGISGSSSGISGSSSGISGSSSGISGSSSGISGSSSGISGSSSGGEAAAATGGGSSTSSSTPPAPGVCDAVAVGEKLKALLNEVAATPAAALALTLADVAALARACRLAGHVPSRKQLQGLAAAFMASAQACAPLGYANRLYMDESDERWLSVYELAEGFGALGFQPDTQCRDYVSAAHAVHRISQPPAAAVATAGACGRVRWWCRVEAAMHFCFPRSPAVTSTWPSPGRLVATEIPAAAGGGSTAVPLPPDLVKALVAVAELPSCVEWRHGVFETLEESARNKVANAAAEARVAKAPPPPSDLEIALLGRVLDCLAVQAGSSGAGASAAQCRERRVRPTVPVDVAAEALRVTFTLPARAALLQALGRAPAAAGGTHLQDLRTALAGSLDLDSSSIHASLRTQRCVAEAYAAAACGVPVGWLRLLVWYGNEMRGGSSKAFAEALQVMLRAAASVSERPAGLSRAFASAGGIGSDADDTSAGGIGSDADDTASTSGDGDGIPVYHEFRLTSMLVDASAAGSLSPWEALEALRNVQVLAKVRADAGGGMEGAAWAAAATETVTTTAAAALLKLASAALTKAAGLEALVAAMEEVGSAALPPLLLGSRQRQLKALLGGDGAAQQPQQQQQQQQQQQRAPERKL